jgi:hypothetical protein
MNAHTVETWTQEQLFEKLDIVGEDQVRRNLTMKVYGDVGNKRAFVQEWLRMKDRAHSDAAEASNRAIAKAARNAAWTANIFAMLALVVAVIALYVARL